MNNHLQVISAQREGTMRSLIRIPVLTLILAFLLVPTLLLNAQTRDYRAERLVLDDNNGNTIIIQTPAGPITGGTLTIPDPAGSGQFLISNPAGGSQSIAGDLLPGTDDTYDLGSGASRWQDIFGSGNISVGGQLQLVETGGGIDYVGFQAPAAVTANQVWTLPAADGTSGQALVTDGAGLLSWATAGGTVTHNATLTGDGTGASPLGINLGNSNTWTANQTFAGTFLITANARIAMTNSDNNSRDLRIQEPSGSGSQYIGIRAPAVTNNGNYVWPAVMGTPGQVLAINTGNSIDSGTLHWTTVAGGTVTTNATLLGDGSGGSPLGINLGNSNTWTANQTFASSFLITANARIALTNSDNNPRDVRWQEPSGSGSQYIGIRAPALTNNGNYVWPAVMGTPGQVLTINTSNSTDSGTLHWTTPTAAPATTRTDVAVGAATVTLAGAGASFIRITGAPGAFTVTGISGGVDGQLLVLYNMSANAMTLSNQDGTEATAANRFATTTGANIGTLATGGGSVLLIYDGGQSRWVNVGAAGI